MILDDPKAVRKLKAREQAEAQRETEGSEDSYPAQRASAAPPPPAYEEASAPPSPISLRSPNPNPNPIASTSTSASFFPAPDVSTPLLQQQQSFHTPVQQQSFQTPLPDPPPPPTHQDSEYERTYSKASRNADKRFMRALAVA